MTDPFPEVSTYFYFRRTIESRLNNGEMFKSWRPTGKFCDQWEKQYHSGTATPVMKSDCKGLELHQGSEQVFSPLGEVGVGL
jgi:hypothetical protein